MRFQTAFFAAGLAQQAFATWNDAGSYTAPDNTDNQCTPSQQQGYDWSGLNPGAFSSYGDNNFGGFKCSSSLGKRDSFTKRTFQDKCITGDVQKQPSISCQSGKAMSIKTMQVSAERDTNFECHYSMPNGGTCKTSHSCKAGGSTIENTQCGGATSVTFKPVAGDNKPCQIGVHQIGFDCNHKPSSSPPVKTTLKTTSKPPTPETSKTTETPSKPATTHTTTKESPSQPAYPYSTMSTETSSKPPKPETSTTTKETSSKETSSKETSSKETSSKPATMTTPESSPVKYTSTTEAKSSSSVAAVSSTSSSSSTSTSTTSMPVYESSSMPAVPSSSPSIPVYETSSVAVVTSSSTSIPVYESSTTESMPVYQPSSTSALPSSYAAVESSSAAAPSSYSASSAAAPSSYAAVTTSAPVLSSYVSPAPAPSSSAPAPECPDVLPKCLNTWIHTTSCKDNTDFDCLCQQNDFIAQAMDCVGAWGSCEESQKAASYFQGLCAKYIHDQPALITAYPSASVCVAPISTTSTIYTTSCETSSDVTVTKTIPLTTTVCPVTATTYSTQVVTITSCAETVTDCPAHSTAVVTSSYPVVPVTTYTMPTTTTWSCPTSVITYSSVFTISDSSALSTAPTTSFITSNSSPLAASPSTNFIISDSSTLSTVHTTITVPQVYMTTSTIAGASSSVSVGLVAGTPNAAPATPTPAASSGYFPPVGAPSASAKPASSAVTYQGAASKVSGGVSGALAIVAAMLML